MSFTLMRYKDGVPKPIKMSIWDAFKGVPSPKPRLHTCDSCKLAHKPGVANPTCAVSKSNAGSKAEADAKNSGNKDGDKSPFTPEEEAKLLVMRGENPGESWRVTLENLGRSDVQVGSAKARYKELQAAQTDKGGGASDVKNNGGGKGKGESEDKAGKEEKDNDNDKEKDESKMTKKEKKAAKACNQDSAKQEANSKEGKSEKDKAGSATVNENAHTSSSNSKEKAESSQDNIKAWAQKYDKQKWVAAASKHFDLTGERITPQQAQKMAAMS